MIMKAWDFEKKNFKISKKTKILSQEKFQGPSIDIEIAKIIAVQAGMVTSVLQQVPNQPIKDMIKNFSIFFIFSASLFRSL